MPVADLQDVTPETTSEEISAYAEQVAKTLSNRLKERRDYWLRLEATNKRQKYTAYAAEAKLYQDVIDELAIRDQRETDCQVEIKILRAALLRLAPKKEDY